MTNFILGVFEITIGMSLFIALLLLGLKVFGGKFTAKCRYIIWALVMLRLAIPFSFGLLPTLIEIPIDTELVQSEDHYSVPSENTDPVTSVQPSDPGNVVVNPTVPSTPVYPTVPTVPNVDPSNPGNAPTLPADQTEPVIPEEPIIETPAEQPTLLKQILDITGIVYLVGVVVFFVWNLSAYVLYTRKILRSAKAVGCWVTRDYRPGDIAIFDFSGSNTRTEHTGIVIEVRGDSLYTIEGNTADGNDSNGGQVLTRLRPLRVVRGAVRPDYDEEETSMDNTPSGYAVEAVKWAKMNGILFGDVSGNLKLHDPVTREQAITFLYRFAKSIGKA